MRKFLLAVVALFCVVLLSSCTLLSVAGGPSDQQRADAQMKKIAVALNSHDAAALKAMFSKRAVEKATDLDARLG